VLVGIVALSACGQTTIDGFGDGSQSLRVVNRTAEIGTARAYRARQVTAWLGWRELISNLKRSKWRSVAGS
jgi:hypothetical protein